MKNIFYVITLIIIFYFFVSDYINFQSNKPSSMIVYGNSIIPKDIVLEHLYNKKTNNDNIYSTMLSGFEIINLSSDKNLVIVKEDLPRFYDNEKIYLNSGLEIIYKNYSNYNSIIGQNDIPKFISYNNNLEISNNVLELINLLSDSNKTLIDNLESITLSKNNVLSVKIKNCNIILMDNLDLNRIKNISHKVLVLKEFINQSEESIDNISHIDLRWNDKIFIKTI